MITYKDILVDKKIIDTYREIDGINNYYMSHGLKHINNVIDICKQLAKCLNISEKETKLLLIAASLHDIGAVHGRKNHNINSSIFARKYLKDNLNQHDLETVCNAIERHGAFTPKENKIDELLCFADKMDFTKKRLVAGYKETSILNNLENIAFSVKDNYFIVKFSTSNKMSFSTLLEEKKNYDEGIKTNVSNIAKRFNLNYKVYWNDTELFSNSKIIHNVKQKK